MERLDWLADNPRYTRRLAVPVGRLCRELSNQAVAEALHLHEHTVKELDKQHMREELFRSTDSLVRRVPSVLWLAISSIIRQVGEALLLLFIPVDVLRRTLSYQLRYLRVLSATYLLLNS